MEPKHRITALNVRDSLTQAKQLADLALEKGLAGEWPSAVSLLEAAAIYFGAALALSKWQVEQVGGRKPK
jgi:hypothetical protein